MAASIALPRVMRIGGGAVHQIGEVATGLGLSRPLVVTDPFLVSTGAAEQMIRAERDTLPLAVRLEELADLWSSAATMAARQRAAQWLVEDLTAAAA